MHFPSDRVLPRWQAAHQARTADASALAELLVDCRARTLALLDSYAAALGDALPVAYSPQVNPPLWELGHIGWFQDYWITRNPQRALGTLADPLCGRGVSRLVPADALYDSSHVEHSRRWHLALPNLPATRAYLAEGLDATLGLLANAASDDATLYFYRLALFHEDMHAEASVYTAQALGITLPAYWMKTRQHLDSAPVQQIRLSGGEWMQGVAAPSQTGGEEQNAQGFAFDNECGAHAVPLSAYAIDDRPVSWKCFLAFVVAGGYTDPRWWTGPGWQWVTGQPRIEPNGQPPVRQAPRYLRQRNGQGEEAVWEQCCFGVWQILDLNAPACHLTYFEVQAWCRWAGRVLPTEVQWEQAAMTRPDFYWGDVWEWTASTFNPYPGYAPHPYRDYSTPWFGSRPVLRGASIATHDRMVHPRYRNYFTPERNDILAGFRTCAPAE